MLHFRQVRQVCCLFFLTNIALTLSIKLKFPKKKLVCPLQFSELTKHYGITDGNNNFLDRFVNRNVCEERTRFRQIQIWRNLFRFSHPFLCNHVFQAYCPVSSGQCGKNPPKSGLFYILLYMFMIKFSSCLSCFQVRDNLYLSREITLTVTPNVTRFWWLGQGARFYQNVSVVASARAPTGIYDTSHCNYSVYVTGESRWRHQMETFSALLALFAGNSPHKGQWRVALMFSLICTWTHGWVNNRDSGELRCHCAHYDVTVMGISKIFQAYQLITPIKVQLVAS